MGLTYAEIEMINGDDLGMARHHIIGEEEIRRMRVNILVDSGTAYLCINESVREILRLTVIEKRWLRMADGRVGHYEIAGPVELRFGNRRCISDAVVLPEGNECLLGMIPMEDMDVIIHPLRQELVVNPESPDMASGKLKGIRSLTRSIASAT